MSITIAGLIAGSFTRRSTRDECAPAGRISRPRRLQKAVDFRGLGLVLVVEGGEVAVDGDEGAR